jgi:pimeloyl-ACP methyl ester carboxylesterase
VAQRPITDIAFSEAATEPAWKTIPSWFVYGDHDTAIPPKLHAWMAGRAHARETVTDYPAWARGVGAVGASNMMMVGDMEATGVLAQIQLLNPES